MYAVSLTDSHSLIDFFFHYLRPMSPAQEVAAILKRRKWTPYMLGKLAKVHPTTIARIVAGKNVTHATMERLRAAAKPKGK